jgi:uncharacterized membrane protein YkvA (DUF1232 family)
MGWVQWLAVAGGVLVILWIVLAVLARRLPPCVAREAALFIPHTVVALKRLLRDPRVPRRVKVGLVIAVVWVASPIDLIPEFLPVIGPLDDLVVVALAFRHAARHSPPEVLREAWPGDPRLLDRLLTSRANRGPGNGRAEAP